MGTSKNVQLYPAVASPVDPATLELLNMPLVKRHRGRIGVAASAAIALVLVPLATPASATWSIVATDPETGQVGAAIASCVSADLVGEPTGPLPPIVLLPGDAVAITQAQLNLTVPSRIRELHAAGVEPAAILDDIVSVEFDAGAALRQHAIASMTDGVVAFTGVETSAVALDRQGEDVSVQGNILVADAVIGDALASFEQERSRGGDLADWLVSGLAAGADAGGDSRCGEQRALFAQLVVANPGDPVDAPSTILTVLVEQGDGQNPVDLLVASHTAGEGGLVDRRATERITGLVVQTGILALGVAMFIVAVYLFRRGFGSGEARR